MKTFFGAFTSDRHANLQLTAIVPDINTQANGTTARKANFTLVSFGLVVALSFLALSISASTAEAATIHSISVANAVAAKQSASVGGIAIGSLGFAALIAFLSFSGTGPKTTKRSRS